METIEAVLARLERLNEIGASLSRERDIVPLLERILLAAKSITNADGGTLYRVTEDGTALRFEIMRTDSLNIAMGGSSATPIKFPNLPLRNQDGAPNDSLVAAHAAIHARTVNVADAYTDPAFDFSGTRRFDQSTGYRSQSFLTVPMKDHEGEVIGVLQLLNAQRPGTTEVLPFSLADQSLVESLASQAAIALTNRLLISQMEVLFESLIRLINVAIEEKSQYTGGHCSRVPELTLMLADAVAENTEGPLADFTMDARDRYELKIAGLLHDCGKITTPVHVVDKATKLETLFDRVALVDTRFEVLKRDAEIEVLRAQLALRPCVDPQAEALAQGQGEAAKLAIDADREFLRATNKGAEYMNDAAIARVQEIASHRVWRNVNGELAPFLTENELENLSIRGGTLTQDERSIINYHIVATIKMLEQLPWPRHLKHVPEYAGGHHERMDGKGYPKGLKREDMSVQARMMGIADIFEALTASDRPYKKGMKLSQAIGIMQKFKDTGHIDPDLFDVFIRQGVHLRYAEQFLEPWQMDALPV